MGSHLLSLPSRVLTPLRGAGALKPPLRSGLLPGHLEFIPEPAPETVPARRARQTRDPAGRLADIPSQRFSTDSTFPEFLGPRASYVSDLSRGKGLRRRESGTRGARGSVAGTGLLRPCRSVASRVRPVCKRPCGGPAPRHCARHRTPEWPPAVRFWWPRWPRPHQAALQGVGTPAFARSLHSWPGARGSSCLFFPR